VSDPIDDVTGVRLVRKGEPTRFDGTGQDDHLGKTEAGRIADSRIHAQGVLQEVRDVVAVRVILLVRQAAGAGGSVDLPTPDVLGNIAMGGSAGKVALSNSSSALSGSTPGGATVVDVVSYGSNATPVEGSPTPNLSNSTAALRNGEGCTDTNDNSADFSVGAPNPRNSSAPAASCEGGGGPGPVDPLAASIPAIQGSGSSSPLVNQVVVTSGVVTRINSNGFFIQALEGDGDPATSDGLFVFTGDTPFPAAQVGSLVQVTGTVREFSAGAGMTAMATASASDVPSSLGTPTRTVATRS
jgi:predicted extracellular nuclease